jgi:hypothetical protein
MYRQISGVKPLICKADENDTFRLPRSDNAGMALSEPS